VSNTLNNAQVTADCGATNHAIGGGGNSATKSLDASYPSDVAGVQVTSGSNPRYWTAKFSGTASQTAFAICVPN